MVAEAVAVDGPMARQAARFGSRARAIEALDDQEAGLVVEEIVELVAGIGDDVAVEVAREVDRRTRKPFVTAPRSRGGSGDNPGNLAGALRRRAISRMARPSRKRRRKSS